MQEASLKDSENGKRPQGDGWYVLNLDEAEWKRHERFGHYCSFEGDKRFRDIGVNVHILEPKQPACLYHREEAQENFLVLSGEALLIVEGQERALRAGDFVHCPPQTTHVFVGAGDGPCAILMIGHRTEKEQIHYPLDETASRHGASAAKATDDPRVAYADSGSLEPCANPWPLSQ